jgi:hypothetical protein
MNGKQSVGPRRSLHQVKTRPVVTSTCTPIDVKWLAIVPQGKRGERPHAPPPGGPRATEIMNR